MIVASSRRSVRIPGAAAVLFLIGTAVASAQAPQIGSYFPQIISIVGTHELRTDVFGPVLDVMTFTGDEYTPGVVLDVQSAYFGAGAAYSVNGAWWVEFESGTATVTVNPVAGTLDFDHAAAGVIGTLESTETTIVSPPNQDPKTGFLFRNGVYWFFASWEAALGELIWYADFVQFFRLEVKALRNTPAGIVEEALPPGTTTHISGNGGMFAGAGDLAAGAGKVLVDGSTWYVDTATPGIPGYRSGGGGGRRTNGGCSMSDSPIATPLPFGAALMSMPNFHEIIGVKFKFHFSTYLIINGFVMDRFDWTWTKTLYLNGTDGPTVAPAPTRTLPGAFDARHGEALGRFLVGDFTGALK